MAGAALVHVFVVIAMLHATVRHGEPDARVVEMNMLVLPPRPEPGRPILRLPEPGKPAPRAAAISPIHRSTQVNDPALPPYAIAASPPASAASQPPDRLQLWLTPSQLKAVESSRPGSLAERLSTPAPVSALRRLGDDDEKLSEIRHGDGSSETRIHGNCVRQVQGLAQRLDPIGHAHDSTAMTGC